MSTRILIADRDDVIRAGMRALLERLEDVIIVGEAADGDDAQRLCHEFAPDIVMLDTSIPMLDDIETMREVIGERSQLKVIICSCEIEHEAIMHAFRAGAGGYLLKDSPGSEFAVALRTVRNGDLYLSRGAAEILAKNYIKGNGVANHSKTQLSSREREVLQQLADGRTNREIGESLQISVKTVEAHRAKLMEKLRLHSVPELTKYAIREGLTSVKI